MGRSEVRERVVLMPMAIRTQDDNGEVVAVLPGWFLPANTIVTAETEDAAIKALQERMWRHWGVEPTQQPNTEFSGGPV